MEIYYETFSIGWELIKVKCEIDNDTQNAMVAKVSDALPKKPHSKNAAISSATISNWLRTLKNKQNIILTDKSFAILAAFINSPTWEEKVLSENNIKVESNRFENLAGIYQVYYTRSTSDDFYNVVSVDSILKIQIDGAMEYRQRWMGKGSIQKDYLRAELISPSNDGFSFYLEIGNNPSKRSLSYIPGLMSSVNVDGFAYANPVLLKRTSDALEDRYTKASGTIIRAFFVKYRTIPRITSFSRYEITRILEQPIPLNPYEGLEGFWFCYYWVDGKNETSRIVIAKMHIAKSTERGEENTGLFTVINEFDTYIRSYKGTLNISKSCSLVINLLSLGEYNRRVTIIGDLPDSQKLATCNEIPAIYLTQGKKVVAARMIIRRVTDESIYKAFNPEEIISETDERVKDLVGRLKGKYLNTED
ncbi:MAG: hypothetical protein RI894_1506 [Bacteroidota bacterium]|jgi:hypothetical protein